MDSNHRRRKPADLQSAPVGRLGIPPNSDAQINQSTTEGVLLRPEGVSQQMTFAICPVGRLGIPPDLGESSKYCERETNGPRGRSRGNIPEGNAKTRDSSRRTSRYRVNLSQRPRIFASFTRQVNRKECRGRDLRRSGDLPLRETSPEPHAKACCLLGLAP